MPTETNFGMRIFTIDDIQVPGVKFGGDAVAVHSVALESGEVALLLGDKSPGMKPEDCKREDALFSLLFASTSSLDKIVELLKELRPYIKEE